jgi:hypothetical protein
MSTLNPSHQIGSTIYDIIGNKMLKYEIGKKIQTKKSKVKNSN